MRPLALLFFTLLSASTLGQSPSSPMQSETARLNSWLNERYEEELRTSPTKLTSLGRRELYDQIGDYSEAGLDAKMMLMTTSLAQMKREFDYDKLSPQGKISYDFWDYRVTQEQAAHKFRRNVYIFNQFTGVHTSFAGLLINYHDVDSTSDMEDYIARIKGSAVALDQLLHRAKHAADDGVRPPRFAYNFVIEESEKLTTGAPFQLKSGSDSPLWADAKQKISSLYTKGLIDKAGVNRLQSQAKLALLEHWQPAYAELVGWIKSDLPNSNAVAQGVSSLPNGKAYYAHQVALNTQTTLSSDEIHAIGLREVARIRNEMLAIKAAVGFTDSLEAFLDFVREDSRFYFPNTDEGRRAYREETTEYLNQMEQRLPKYFNLLPLAKLEVKRVEAFQEQDGAAAYYKEGTADGSRPGVYYLHLSDMSAMNKTDLETTAYHEGNPGHHLQGSIALERKELPLFRTIVWYSAYGEGWALYSEYLAKEMSAFENPYYDFGRLSNEIWRAVRLVIDTGIHAKGWSERRAIEYMLANTASPVTTVRSEVQRYFVAPGQALSYKMGMLKILELRAHAKASLGEKFDIRGFHDVILGGGSVPLPLLQRAVDDWIATQGSISSINTPSFHNLLETTGRR